MTILCWWLLCGGLSVLVDKRANRNIGGRVIPAWAHYLFGPAGLIASLICWARGTW